MAIIKVTSDQLRSVSNQLRTGSDDVSQQLQSMESQVKALVDADWEGAASDSFRDLWDQWHTGARQVKEALDGISQQLGTAAQTYQDTEDQLAAQMRG
ncbi:MAG: WXG100 family type VII secretion target [Egibacteraceae bacterium]